MLERTFGYKGPIPRISYSRYMSIDKINVFSLDAHEKIYEESGSGFKKLPCSRLNKDLFECDKVKKKGMSRLKLLKNEEPSRAGDKNHTQGKTHLSPPPQGFQATSGNRLNIVRKEALTHQRNPKFGRLRKHFNKLRQGLVLLASNQPKITELTEDHAVHSSVRESFVAKTMIFHCLVKKYG